MKPTPNEDSSRPMKSQRDSSSEDNLVRRTPLRRTRKLHSSRYIPASALLSTVRCAPWFSLSSRSCLSLPRLGLNKGDTPLATRDSFGVLVPGRRGHRKVELLVIICRGGKAPVPVSPKGSACLCCEGHRNRPSATLVHFLTVMNKRKRIENFDC